jgi:hypothetical protein
MAARRFLFIIGVLVGVVLLGAVAFRLFGGRLIATATKPRVSFAESAVSPAPDYTRADAWIARPGRAGDPGLFTPQGFQPAPRPAAAVFYVAPTAYTTGDRWTANLADQPFRTRIASLTAAQSSIANGVAAVWAPYYRQAVFGAFLSERGADRDQALALAYSDVRRAWEAFLAANPSGPIILIGHSQGALHLSRLLAEAVARDPQLRQRIVAAYLPGWPLSVETDLPAMRLRPCTGMETTGCALSWQSFAEPADTRPNATAFAQWPGIGGPHAKGEHMLCVNPIRGLATEAGAVAAANLGSLQPAGDDPQPRLVPGKVGAQCRGGFLIISQPPEGFDRYVLPGNNYHLYDVHLFWVNLRADVERRTNAWMGARLPAAKRLPETP